MSNFNSYSRWCNIAFLLLAAATLILVPRQGVADHPGKHPGSNMKGKTDVFGIAASRTQFLPSSPPGKVTVQLLATAVSAKVPGKFNFHFAAAEMKELLYTVSEPKGGKPLLKGDLIKGGIAFVEPGKLYTLQIVYNNPTDQEVKFLVNAPMIDPSIALPFARALCWCAAIPFTVPAGGTFSRTIKVGVGPETPPGAKAIVEWPVIALKE